MVIPVRAPFLADWAERLNAEEAAAELWLRERAPERNAGSGTPLKATAVPASEAMSSDFRGLSAAMFPLEMVWARYLLS